ncbi:metallophosphoesterase family protein [Rhizobium lusitanum]|uniref:Icc protein n=1 Tax=Rhizobium lusitanum TaxID=293958 RepID=A0A7X0IQH5_9HYPH|nr:metallophosphoesterase [Rhizobium lusitanum]MBB6484828.1 Icc protein [Rhizobium lusitanum]
MTKTTIAFLTDTHLGQKLVMNTDVTGGRMRYDSEPKQHEDRLRLVLDDIVRRGISDIVFGGDIGTVQSVSRFFEILRGYDFNISVILGNHDVYADVMQYWTAGENAVNGKLCYSHAHRHLKRIFLDTSDNILGDNQRAWLARELDDVENAVLFVHHPILAVPTPVDRSGAALRDRDEIRSLLNGLDCDITIFSGHYHMMDEARDGNIRQFVSPAVSYQIFKQSDELQADAETFGYRIIELEDTRIKTRAVLLNQASPSR